jgi:CheY-like chemotaxis protein
MSTGSTGRRRVAVVEDNADNRLLVATILEGRYEVSLFPDGPSALEGCAAAPPDLVLLDISLPGMDGTEVLRRMRADDRLAKLPVLALTADAGGDARERYLALGFDDYVSKPIVDVKDLRATIARILGE